MEANENGGFDVLGSNTYAHAGYYNVQIIIENNSTGYACVTGSATVANAALTPQGTTLSSDEDDALGTVAVATRATPAPAAPRTIATRSPLRSISFCSRT